MADDWSISAVVNNTGRTPPIDTTFHENVKSDENPLEFLNHLTFGEDEDGMRSYSEIVPPKFDCVQDDEDQDYFRDLFVVATSSDHSALQGGGDNTLNPTPIASVVNDVEVVPVAPQDLSPFLSQQHPPSPHPEQQQQHQQHRQHQQHQMIHPNHFGIVVPDHFMHDNSQQMIHPNHYGITGQDNFIYDHSQQQFGHIQRPILRPQPLFQRQSAPPVPIPRLPSQAITRSRPRTRASNRKRDVEKVPADQLKSGVWSWRKYGQKPIKGSPYPRNYYRCSTVKGCMAKRQVEKSFTEPDMFIVCYNGEHNHGLPADNRNTHAKRSRYLGKPLNVPLNKDAETSSAAPLAPVQSEPNMSGSTPLSASQDQMGNGAENEGGPCWYEQ